MKIQDSHFVGRSILHLVAFLCLRFTLKFFVPEALECWPFSAKKLHDMTSLQRHFLKHFLTQSVVIVYEDTKLMLNKVS